MASTILTTTTTSTGNSAWAKTLSLREKSSINYQATVTGTGSVSATVVIECSNDNSNWVTLGTISLSGTTSATDGFSAVVWPYSRSNVTAISGTGATVVVTAS